MKTSIVLIASVLSLVAAERAASACTVPAPQSIAAPVDGATIPANSKGIAVRPSSMIPNEMNRQLFEIRDTKGAVVPGSISTRYEGWFEFTPDAPFAENSDYALVLEQNDDKTSAQAFKTGPNATVPTAFGTVTVGDATTAGTIP